MNFKNKHKSCIILDVHLREEPLPLLYMLGNDDDNETRSIQEGAAGRKFLSWTSCNKISSWHKMDEQNFSCCGISYHGHNVILKEKSCEIQFKVFYSRNFPRFSLFHLIFPTHTYQSLLYYLHARTSEKEKLYFINKVMMHYVPILEDFQETLYMRRVQNLSLYICPYQFFTWV